MMKKETDIAARLAEHEILDLFPREDVAMAVADRFVERLRTLADEPARAGNLAMARSVAIYANHQLYSNMSYRDGDMSAWHAMASTSLDELASRGATLVEAYGAIRSAMTEEELDLEGEQDAVRELETERQDRLEDEGFYGRTGHVHPDSSRWIYIRFGSMPVGGRSVFGLAGEDNEDGPDEWRIAMGNKTRESGICVLQARHHPSVPGAYLVIEPNFDKALYSLPDTQTYLLSIIPQYREDEHPSAMRIDGLPVTCKARDGTDRLELGSDGEYMIDPSKPIEIHDLSLDSIYIDKKTSAADFLADRRKERFPGL